jgi:hypothetical protein
MTIAFSPRPSSGIESGPKTGSRRKPKRSATCS